MIVRKIQVQMLRGLTAQERATFLRLVAKAIQGASEASRPGPRPLARADS
ncbi:MAG: hypothetical protein U0232_32840 [Thermomicrobiales bacterium]